MECLYLMSEIARNVDILRVRLHGMSTFDERGCMECQHFMNEVAWNVNI